MALLCSDHPTLRVVEGGGAIWPFLWDGPGWGRNHSSGQGSHQPAGTGQTRRQAALLLADAPCQGVGLTQPDPPPSAAGPPQEQGQAPLWHLGRGRERRMEVGRGRGDKGCPEKGDTAALPARPRPPRLAGRAGGQGRKRGVGRVKSHLSQKGQESRGRKDRSQVS